MQMYSFLDIKPRQSLKKSQAKINMISVIRDIRLKRNILTTAEPYITIWIQVSNTFTEYLKLCPLKTNT